MRKNQNEPSEVSQNSNGEKRRRNHNVASRRIKSETIHRRSRETNPLHPMREEDFAIRSTRRQHTSERLGGRAGIHSPKNLGQDLKRVKLDTRGSRQHGTSPLLHAYRHAPGMMSVTSQRNLQMPRREPIPSQNLRKLLQSK